MKNHYEILGVSPEATAEEINRAYKKLAQKYHPDASSNDPLLAEKFKDITDAREVLMDDEKREEFDWLLNNFSGSDLGMDEIQELQRKQAQEHRKKRSEQFKRAKTFKKITLLIILVACGFVILNLLRETNSDETQLVVNSSKEIEPGIETKIAEKDTVQRSSSFTKTEISTLNKPVNSSETRSTSTAARPKKKNDSILSPRLKPRAYKTRIDKSLTDWEMRKVLKEIDRQKIASRVNTSCVKLVKSKSSNVVNGFDMAKFLQANGYVISGREMIESNRKGIRVNAKGNCITILIGTL